MRLEKLTQRERIARSTLFAAHRVQPQFEPAQPEFPVHRCQHPDHFGIEPRGLRSERLHSQLIVLTIPPRLRALVAEHRTVVIELHRLRQRMHPVLYEGTSDWRRPLRAQGHAAAA